MSKPIRWFSMPQLFRYERQQRGRLKEHFQWNVDIVGESGVAADVEVLAVGIDGLRALGLTSDDFAARVSDRRLLTAVLGALGVSEQQLPGTFALVDKSERQPKEKSRAHLTDEVGVDPSVADQVLGMLDDSSIEALTERFADRDDVGAALEPVREYIASLEAMGLGDFVEVDLTIVRGLAYYTGIVFELFDCKRELRSICGGGRYDRLLELVGGEALPAVGFGMGDVVLGELLADRSLIPEYQRSLDYFLVLISEEQRPQALGIAHRLRESGKSVAYVLSERGVAKQMKVAAKEGARRVLIVGPEELARDSVLVKDMVSGEQSEVGLDELT
jgi:histidyl-tRNA synthetase